MSPRRASATESTKTVSDVPEVRVPRLLVCARLTRAGNHHVEGDTDRAVRPVGVASPDLPQGSSAQVHAVPRRPTLELTGPPWRVRLSEGLGVTAVRGKCLSLDSQLVQPVDVCRDSIRVREEGRTIDPRTIQRQLDCRAGV